MSERLCVKPAEAAQMLGVSKPVIYELCSRSDFPSLRLGRAILIPVDGLREWLAQQAHTQPDG